MLLPLMLMGWTSVATAASAGEVSDVAPAQPQIEWRFDQDGDFRGWQPGGHLTDVRVGQGALRGRTSDWDPILLGPVFEIAASPSQEIVICLRTSAAGRGEVFWTETLEGPHGGFNQEKTVSFSTRGDEQFHSYRLTPFWQAAGKVIRLRFDPPSPGEFEIRSIAIEDRGLPKAVQQTAWDAAALAGQWQPWQQIASCQPADGHLSLQPSGSQPLLMSPLLDAAASDFPIVAIRMAVTAGKTGRLLVASNRRRGSDSLDFRLRPDGRMHTYNLDVAALDGWRERIVMLGLQPTDAAGARVQIASVEFADQPTGPPDLSFAYAGSATGVDRVGQPAEVLAVIRNHGGRTAEQVTVWLETGAAGQVIEPARQTVERVSPDLPQTVRWQVRSDQPGDLPVSVGFQTPGGEPLVTAARLNFLPPPAVAPQDYLPPPIPVKPRVDVGVFYFPGWDSWSRWRPILDYPDRRPVLGWYDEANPECADWQIKWAVEHGVSFFMVDWYWVRGQRQLDHWVHRAYQKARFRPSLKWCVMWANHNPPNTHSRDDWQAVTQYWLDHYFAMPEYYRIDGRPAVFIWSPHNIRQDLGGSQQAAQLYALSQQMAREAGYPGIHFAAMSSHESATRCGELRAEGYESFTSYHGFELAERQAGSTSYDFQRVVDTARDTWQQADQRASGLTYIPIVDTGWSSEPWHGDEARVISGRTPAAFGQLCRQAAEYAAGHGKQIVAIGPWNEWGEGSYIEPHAGHGFEDLDQLRIAFCEPGDWPPNLIPADLGRGPYDLAPQTGKTVWTFDGDDMEGWSANGLLAAHVANGCLRARSIGSDPILQAPYVLFEADAHPALLVRMSSTANDTAQLFWSTTRAPLSEANSVRFAVSGDGQLRDYRLDLRAVPRWRGVITGLRLDPANGPGTEIVIDRIELLGD